MSTTTPPPTTTTTTTAPHRSRTLLYAIIIIILIVVGVGVYYLTRGPSTTTSTPQIKIVDDGACAPNATACAFQPANYTTTVNNATTWTNNGKVSHTVTTCDATNSATATDCPTMDAAGLDSFNSNTISGNGGTYSHTFTKAGTYYYYCAIHPWMHGSVTTH